ncbi:MAG: hypothetical protein U0R71_05425 [Solirubrobacterales bacterium]
MRTRAVLVLTVAALAFVVLGVSAAAGAAPKLVGADGVAGLRLGTPAAALRGQGKIGPLRPGCELNPVQRIAKLRAPLSGFAIFNHRGRRLSALSLEGGVETARGIRVGSTAAAARGAYPAAVYQAPGTADPFAEGFLWINSPAHPAMTLIVDPATRRVENISVHAPNFCE